MLSNRLLILSDGKPGHLNQSIAFAKHLGCEFDICTVVFKNRLAKAVSYFADRIHLSLAALFRLGHVTGDYRAVVSAGSETYYANRVLANKLGIKSVAIMLPQGYRYDFDLIVAQQHDDPPEQDNIVSIPINLTYVEPQGLVCPEKGCKYVSLIIGGDSKQGKLDPERLREQVKQIFSLFPGHDFWMTTSRRTSFAVESVLREFRWTRAVYYSEEQINPIADYLQHSEYVFLTADSTSMISEAVSFGRACVEILPPAGLLTEQGKFSRMIAALQEASSLQLFTVQVGAARQKIDIESAVQRAVFLLDA